MPSALSRPTQAHVPAEREVHVRSGMAALARCRALLIGIVTLDRAGRADVVGIALRAMLEAWYFGVIALLGDEGDLARLEADHRYWKNEFARRHPGDPIDEGIERRFSVWDRAKRAGELMDHVEALPSHPLDWYTDVYAGESLTNAHASPSSIGPYLFVDESGVVGVDQDPQLDEELRSARLLLAVGLTSTLGGWVYERAGIDTTELLAIDVPLPTTE